MAQISNPRKDFNFSIQVVQAPINPFLVQKVTLPEITIAQVKHGDTNHDIKTGGRVEYGDIEIEKIMTTSGADNYFYDWASTVADSIIGGGLVPEQYWRTLIISELAEDGTSILNSWIARGCWPTKINGQELNRMSSENSLEKIQISTNGVEKL